MKRWVFTIVSVLSLLLFVAVCVLWVRSYFVQDDVKGRWTKNGNDTVVMMICDSGSFHASIYCISRANPDPEHRDGRKVLWSEDEPSGQRPGGMFYFNHDAFRLASTSFTTWKLTAPLWVAVLATAALPTVSLVTTLRRRRRGGLGRCPSCGYDLRATPGRCPECGLVPAAPPPPPTPSP